MPSPGKRDTGQKSKPRADGDELANLIERYSNEIDPVNQPAAEPNTKQSDDSTGTPEGDTGGTGVSRKV